MGSTQAYHGHQKLTKSSEHSFSHLRQQMKKTKCDKQLKNLATNDFCHIEDGQIHGNNDKADATTNDNDRERFKQ